MRAAVLTILASCALYSQETSFQQLAETLADKHGITVEVAEELKAAKVDAAASKQENPFAAFEEACKANGKAMMLFEEQTNGVHIFQTQYIPKTYWSDSSAFVRIESCRKDIAAGVTVVATVAFAGSSVACARAMSLKVNGKQVITPESPYRVLYGRANFMTGLTFTAGYELFSEKENSVELCVETVECSDKEFTLKESVKSGALSFSVKIEETKKKTARLTISAEEKSALIGEFPLERRIRRVQAVTAEGKCVPLLVISATSGQSPSIDFALEDSTGSEEITGIRFLLAESLHAEKKTAKLFVPTPE